MLSEVRSRCCSFLPILKTTAPCTAYVSLESNLQKQHCCPDPEGVTSRRNMITTQSLDPEGVTYCRGAHFNWLCFVPPGASLNHIIGYATLS
ncbi:MAG: hypothetical protein ACI9NN_002121, partial [Bacteroidia bacterium]